jgi:GGDEF domain-containing protein
VANALRASCDSAVIARSRGDEFIVADTCRACDPVPLARRICQSIAVMPAGITASVGTSCARLDGMHDTLYQPLVDVPIGLADEAMYRAKRNGGNGSHHHEWCG